MTVPTQDELKRLVGVAALAHVVPGAVLGVGTGSTVNCFIDALAASGIAVAGAVSSSEASTKRLVAAGIRVLQPADLAGAGAMPVYIDGADEIDHRGRMIKGGGGALTREKIVADLADRFVCIADASKLVDRLGGYPLPVEVLPMALGPVARRLAALGGEPRQRAGFVTDNGGLVLDVHGLVIDDPEGLEREVERWPGVICCGLFADRQRAAVCLLAAAGGVRTLTF